jgi:DNA-directed RNA polymerase subunit RPC12/RpoP
MDSPVQHPGQQPAQQQLGQLTCTTCGKRFRYRPDLAGRTVKCPCGARIMVPRVQMPVTPVYTPDDAPDREYDMTGSASAPKSTRATTVPPVGLSAHAGAADEPFDEDDDLDLAKPAAPAPVKTVRVANLPPQPSRLKQEERKPDEEIFKPSTLRDWVVPSILIGIGIVLRFCEVMAPWAVQDPMPVGGAIAAVTTKLAMSVFLMLAGMMMAVNVMEICFLGPLSRTAYKLIAVGIAPGALYSILSFMGGEPYGAMLGTFVSVVVYAVLFWSLMRLDLKDTSMCVILTWILVTAANYIAYKAEGLMQDSWV